MKFAKIFSVFIIISLFLPSFVRADLISPPVELFATPLTLGLFFANLIINFVIFGMAYIIFVGSNIKKINKKSFLVTLFLITIIGFLSDSITFQYIGTENFFAPALFLGFLIFTLDFFICKYYLKLNSKKSLILGIWMGIFTNPFIFLILTFFLSFPFIIFVPSHPNSLDLVKTQGCNKAARIGCKAEPTTIYITDDGKASGKPLYKNYVTLSDVCQYEYGIPSDSIVNCLKTVCGSEFYSSYMKC